MKYDISYPSQSLTSEWSDTKAKTQAEYQALVRSLEWTDGFRLLFVRCSPAEGEGLVTKVKQDLTQKSIEVESLEQPIDNLHRLVNKRTQKRQLDILFIKGIENSFLKYITSGFGGQGDYYKIDSVPRVLGNLNLQRERFRDEFGICFVFLLPLFGLKYFIRRAPDFFDWNSGVFEFLPKPEVVEQESLRILQSGSYRQYRQLTSQEQSQKILEITEILEEPHLFISRRKELLLELATLQSAARNYTAAVTSYDQALAIQPDNYQTWHYRGLALENLGLYEEAIASYNQAQRLNPYHCSCWSHRGDVLNKLGRYEEAVASYDQALAIQPDYHNAWHHRGIALKNLGHYQKAIANYDHALKIQPNDFRAWFNRGNADKDLGKPEQAKASYHQALKIQPDFPPAWIALGNLGDLQAVKPLIELLQTHPDTDIRYEAAEALGDVGTRGRGDAGTGRRGDGEMGKIGIPHNNLFTLAQQALLTALQDQNADVCAVAIRSLGSYGDVNIAPQLVKQLTHQDRYVREDAAVVLGNLAQIPSGRTTVLPLAVQPLIRLMRNDPIRDVREATEQVLSKIAALAGEEPEIGQAKQAIQPGKSVKVEELLISSSVEYLHLGENKAVRRSRCRRLGRRQKAEGKEEGNDYCLSKLDINAQEGEELDSKTVAEKLTQLLIDYKNNPDERAAAAIALGNLLQRGENNPLVEKDQKAPLPSCLQFPSKEGLGVGSSIKALIKALDDKDRFVREAAAKTLGKLRVEEAIEALDRVNREEVISNVRQAAEAALYDIYQYSNSGEVKAKAGSYWQFARRIELPNQSEIEETIPTLLLKLTNRNDAYERFQAAESLRKALEDSGDNVDPEIINSLIEALEDPHPEVRVAAAHTLGVIGCTQAIEPLLNNLQRKDRFVRAAVAKALGNLAAEAAVGSLIHLWRNDAIADVRDTAKYAVWTIYQKTQNATAHRALKRAGYPPN
ncbi:MAG: tetratricopeptide repeat protein [Symploca sp. SIO1B1]|nr:tetratricopeptide repeat protein [Symploca sp. SIO1B1]